MVKGDSGAHFENLVAVSLLKDLWGRNDYLGEEWRLQYLRTKEGKETDFALVKDERLQQIIECKTSDSKPDRHLRYFSSKYSLKATQLVVNLRNDHTIDGIKIRRAERYLEELFL